MKPQWRDGNRISLLENGEQFYPRVFEAIESARREVLLETFIWFDDIVGRALHAVLLGAAKRGVQVDVTVDGYGSPDLSPEFIGALTAAGVHFHVFDPRRRVFGFRTNLFRRMHRKIVVVDATLAFVGGINYAADHLFDYGPEAKQDYAAELEGPVVADIHRFARSAIVPAGARRRWWRRSATPPAQSLPVRGTAQILFVTRDNRDHRDDIERHYRVAIRAARREVVIANAYFFPGYRLLRELRRAARRGVAVHLILQGQPDMPIVKIAAGLLYDYLLNSGVTIHEYCERPLHGKVALTDDEWATIGSSNLDPLSLSLNLEANVMVRDVGFNRQLRGSLQELIELHCQRLGPADAPRRTLWRALVGAVVFHFLRRFPAWAGWLPAHAPRLTSLPPRAVAGANTVGADRVQGADPVQGVTSGQRATGASGVADVGGGAGASGADARPGVVGAASWRGAARAPLRSDSAGATAEEGDASADNGAMEVLARAIEAGEKALAESRSAAQASEDAIVATASGPTQSAVAAAEEATEAAAARATATGGATASNAAATGVAPAAPIDDVDAGATQGDARLDRAAPDATPDDAGPEARRDEDRRTTGGADRVSEQGSYSS